MKEEGQLVIYSCILFLSLDTGSIVFCVTSMFIDESYSFTDFSLLSDCEIRIMSSAKLQFLGSLTQTDPSIHPVVIIGQVKNLAKIKFSDLKVKLEPRVTEEVCSHCN